MATITSILARISELTSRNGKNSIGKNDLFGLMTDMVKRQQSTELNMSNLSLRKIYASVAAMNADVAAPVGDDGQKVLNGQVVVISAVGADMGKVYRYSGTAWEYVGQIGDLSQKAEKVYVDELNNKLSTIEAASNLSIIPILLPYNHVSAGSVISVDNKLTIPVGQTGFDSRIGYVIPASIRQIAILIVSDKILGFDLYRANQDMSNTVNILSTVNTVLTEDGSYVYNLNYTIPGISDQVIFLFKRNVVMPETTVVYFKSIIDLTEVLAKGSELEKTNINVQKITDVIEMTKLNLVEVGEKFSTPNNGGTVSIDNKLTIPIGQTGFDSRIGWVIPATIRDIEFTMLSTKSNTSFNIFISSAGYLSPTQITTPAWTLLESGLYGFTLKDIIISGTELKWLWIQYTSQVIRSEALIINFDSVFNNGVRLVDMSMTEKIERDILGVKEDAMVLSDRVQVLEDFFIDDVLSTLTPVKQASAGATISVDNKLTIPIGQTGFDSRIGVEIPASLRDIEFRILSNKQLSGINIYLSDAGYINAVQIPTPVWELQSGGLYGFTVPYLIPENSLKWLWMHQGSNTIRTDSAGLYFSNLFAVGDSKLLRDAYNVSKNGIRTIESLGNDTGNASAFNGTDGICTNKVYASGIGKIKKISFDATQTGVAGFATGIVDQWGIAIIDKTFEIVVPVAGYQTHDVDIEISTGQMLFAFLDSKIIGFCGDNSSIPSLIYYNDQNRAAALQTFPEGESGHISLAFEVEYATENFIDIYAKVETLKSEANVLGGKVLALQNNTFVTDKVTGEKYKISISNGSLFAKSTIVKKVLALGNSITRHSITPFWWGDWGMAATERSKDWVHMLETKLKIKWPTAIVNAWNIATFEMNPLTYNFADLDGYLTNDVDVVILKIGENVSQIDNYALKFPQLVDHIWSKVPNCDIIIGGMNWPGGSKEIMMKQLADERGIPFIDISFMWNDPQYLATLDTMVYGDDLVWHEISEGGENSAWCCKSSKRLRLPVNSRKIRRGIGVLKNKSGGLFK